MVIAITMFCNIGINAQKIAEKKVPENVKSTLKAKFPTATNVKWEMEDKTRYEAVFKLNNETVSANFSKEGKWLSSEKELKFSQLPKAVQDVLKKQYPTAKYTEIAEEETLEKGTFLDIDLMYNKKKFVIEIKSTGEILKTKEIKAKK